MSKLRGTVATVATMAASVALAPYGWASSHREAPGIISTPQIDGTDLYAFRSFEPGREDFVVFIANYYPLQLPFGGPNYYPLNGDAVYEIHIDNDGDAVEDKTFQFNFDFELLDEGIQLEVGDVTLPIALRYGGQITAQKPLANRADLQTYRITHIEGDRRSGKFSAVVNVAGGGEVFRKPIDYVGQKTLPNYEAYAQDHIFSIAIPGCPQSGRVFVGQREEAFAINLGESFDLVNYVPIEAGSFPGGIVEDPENGDLINNVNVTTLAIEIPIACAVGDSPEPIIGVWTTSSIPQAQLADPDPTFSQFAVYGGAYTQRSRLANPLVNELVIGLPEKNDFNASEPINDEQFLNFVTNPTFPAVLNNLFLEAVNDALGTKLDNLAPQFFPRTDLVATFLTGIPGLNQPDSVTPSEMMRLNLAIPPTPLPEQGTLGVLSGDLAGFPNGRRPTDDVVDIELRVLMGRLCYPIEVPGQGDPLELGLCPQNRPATEVAPVGNVPFTDGAPITAANISNRFPFLETPIPGSPEEARDDEGEDLD